MRAHLLASLVLVAMSSFALARPAIRGPALATTGLPVIDAQPPHAQPPHAEALAGIDRAAVRAALARARATNLAAFRAYARRGVFPSNVYKPGALNVWRDENGHLCAAATIIDQSGQHELVQRVAKDDDFIRLADVTAGPLMDWMLTSGLTQDELVAIQKPFMPVTQRPDVQQPGVVDATMRAKEDARLRAKYAEVARALVANERASLELATDRLMQHPALARHLLGS